LLGTRLTMLVFSISPVLAAILAWLFLNENLTFFQITGMIVTIAGVAWVVSEKNNGNNPGEPVRSNNWKGLLAALAGALGQAGGMILAKKGLGGDFPAISGHIIRLSTAALVIWVMAFFQGQAKTTVMTMKNKSGALRFTTLGVLFGPLVGVWFSLIAIQATSVGIATTLMALPPIFLLPIGYFIFKERISPRAIVGTLVALAGVAMLFLI
ncbi:MAG: DMT family transporter, partial [Anaerolineae bacterium]|nr:DMT family transporter [Anaerolineae bacterium]